MAVYTLSRTILVNDNLLFRDLLGLRMALCASHVGMATGQRQVGFVMVKRRGGPPLGRMAVLAAGRAVLGDKLPVVRVPMAGFARHGCALESLIRVAGCLVTLSARYRAMRSEKRELGL